MDGGDVQEDGGAEEDVVGDGGVATLEDGKGTLRISKGGVTILDDFRESYWWLRDNTAEDARVMAWWDYGYQINGVANRTTLLNSIKQSASNSRAESRKAAERKSMPPLVALKLEMEEAFQIFDLDGSGEIDRLEFRHLLRGGALFKLARDEIDDVYTQIDKDRSGAVDFEEFWAWCQFEFSKTPNRKIKVPMILSAKERAERRLLVEVRSKSAGAVRGSGIPPDSSTKPGSPLTIERSPTKERLRQEKKRFLDEDDEEEDDGGSISASIAELEGNSAVESPVEAEAEAGGSVGTSKAGEIHGEIQ